MDSNVIIKQEIETILEDIRLLYLKSGKKTSGQFEQGLKATYSNNKAVINGYQYLAGRRAGKMPPIENIKQWIIQKGLKPIKDNISISGLAWAIAKKIAKEGTKKENNLKIYETVVTPKRIDDVIKKVSQFNVQLFVNELTTSLNLLTKNI
ncbi:MAG: hypothetical protein Q8O62_04410 [Aequorivita sp.]|nr:hypothetical protein [Aequorivita sp.]